MLHGSTVAWGRKSTADSANALGALALIVACPVLIIFLNIALEKHDASLTKACWAFLRSPEDFIWTNLPWATPEEVGAYGAWILLQLALYAVLPGSECTGQLTPGGHRLRYEQVMSSHSRGL